MSILLVSPGWKEEREEEGKQTGLSVPLSEVGKAPDGVQRWRWKCGIWEPPATTEGTKGTCGGLCPGSRGHCCSEGVWGSPAQLKASHPHLPGAFQPGQPFSSQRLACPNALETTGLGGVPGDSCSTGWHQLPHLGSPERSCGRDCGPLYCKLVPALSLKTLSPTQKSCTTSGSEPVV